jgi:hypothetical protein
MNYAQAIQGMLSLSELNLESKLALTELYYFADMSSKAEGVIKDIIAEGGENFRILNSIGHFYLNRLHRLEKALVFFDKSLAVQKDQPEIARLVRRLRNDFLNQLSDVW